MHYTGSTEFMLQVARSTREEQVDRAARHRQAKLLHRTAEDHGTPSGSTTGPRTTPVAIRVFGRNRVLAGFRAGSAIRD